KGNNRQAEAFYRRALGNPPGTLGDGDPDYAQTPHDPGAPYDLLGRRPAAGKPIPQGLEGRRRAGGGEAPDYAPSPGALARRVGPMSPRPSGWPGWPTTSTGRRWGTSTRRWPGT